MNIRPLLIPMALVILAVSYAFTQTSKPSALPSSPSAHNTQRLNAARAQQFITETKNLFLLDVRTVNEFNEKHLPGALNIPMGELEKRIDELPADKPILIYCRSGRRAKVAQSQIAKLRPELTAIHVLDDYPAYPVSDPLPATTMNTVESAESEVSTVPN